MELWQGVPALAPLPGWEIEHRELLLEHALCRRIATEIQALGEAISRSAVDSSSSAGITSLGSPEERERLRSR